MNAQSVKETLQALFGTVLTTLKQVPFKDIFSKVIETVKTVVSWVAEKVKALFTWIKAKVDGLKNKG